MKKYKLSLTRYKDERFVELVRKTDHKTLAVWAIDCAEHVLPYFEGKYPEDHRPRNAIDVDVIRFCHRLNVKGKCHHGRKGDIELERGNKGNHTE